MNLTMRTTCGPTATTGTLSVGALTLHTIERPWQNNQQSVSCVPAGTFQLIRYLSPKHGLTWRLHNPDLNVWGLDAQPPRPMRTEIEVHSMNFARQSEGCIGPGLSNEPMLDGGPGGSNKVEPAVQDSVAAIEKLRDLLVVSESDVHSLTITRGGIYTAYSPEV